MEGRGMCECCVCVCVQLSPCAWEVSLLLSLVFVSACALSPLSPPLSFPVTQSLRQYGGGALQPSRIPFPVAEPWPSTTSAAAPLPRSQRTVTPRRHARACVRARTHTRTQRA